MGIGEVKTAVEILEKTGMSPAAIAGCVVALVFIIVYGSVMVKMCRVMIDIGRLMIKWDKAQEVDRATYHEKFLNINKTTDDHAARIDDHSEEINDCKNRISVLEK